MGGLTLRRSVTHHRGHANRSGPRTRHGATSQPDPGGTSGVLGMGGGGSPAPHRHPGRGAGRVTHPSVIQYGCPPLANWCRCCTSSRPRPTPNGCWSSAPELADVLGTIICRVRDPDGACPSSWPTTTTNGCSTRPCPSCSNAGRHREPADQPPRSAAARRRWPTGLTEADGRPLRFTPHDFRRIFVTDAVLNGMPPTSPSWSSDTPTSTPPWATRPSTPKKSSPPTERSSPGGGPRPRRNTAPPPTPNGRSFSATSSDERSPSGLRPLLRTPCIHEHACIRCPLLRPIPPNAPG